MTISTKNTYQNESLKMSFADYLRGLDGFSEKSIESYMRAIKQWQIFSGDKDFYLFDKKIALDFREWLRTRPSGGSGKTLAIRTQDNYLRRVKKFFEWLDGEPSKKPFKKNDLGYLRLSNADQKTARNQPKKIPCVEEAKKLFHGIDDSTPIGRRDKAFISIMITTGARVGALTTLRLKNFNSDQLCIYQYPSEGVKTKNRKYIETTFIPMEWTEPQEYFLRWHSYLLRAGFDENDPLFPANMREKIEGRLRVSTTTINRDFLKGSSSATKILKKRCGEAGVSYYHPHAFRDLFVSIIMEHKLSPTELKALSVNLGHADIRTTLESYGNQRTMESRQAVDIVKKMNVLKAQNMNMPPEVIEAAQIVSKYLTQ